MMTKKKRRILWMVPIVLIAIILIVTFIVLYQNTDLFRSNDELFAKYLGQNIKNLEEVYEQAKKSEYREFLKQNPYESTTEMKVNYVENKGTSLESTQNSINLLKLEKEGQVDPNSQYNYQAINLLKEDETIAKVETIQEGNTYGIRFSDLFQQYLLVKNENLKTLFQKMGFGEEQVEALPDQIEINPNAIENLTFSTEEKKNLSTQYAGIFQNEIKKENCSKQKDQMIEVNGIEMKTNSYQLTLTKEQLNNFYIKLLEELKQDEIILSKLDTFQGLLDGYQKFTSQETISIREEFAKQIESQIQNIQKDNIGQEEVKIMVYEKDGKTVKTIIKGVDYEIQLEVLSKEDPYLKLSYQNSNTEQVLSYQQKKENKNLTFKDRKGESVKEYTFSKREVLEDTKATKELIVRYEDDSNQIEGQIHQKVNKMTNLEKKEIFDEKNAIDLSELEEENLKVILNQVNQEISKRVNEITQEKIKGQDFLKILQTMGIMKQESIIQETGVTEIQKNRFNSKFEILQGENLSSENVLKVSEAIKDNLIDIEILSETQLKLKLDQVNKNEEKEKELNSFIEKNKNKNYTVKLEYDQTTGLVEDILLTIISE